MDNILNDLELNTRIFDTLNKTITVFGKKKLEKKLSYYVSDIDVLNKRTNLNLIIHQDQEYKDTMSSHLIKIRDIQDTVYKWIEEKCNENLLFRWNFLNNRVLLSVTNTMKYLSFTIIILFYLILYFYLYNKGLMNDPKKYIQSIIDGYYRFVKLIMYFLISNRLWIERSAVFLTTLYIGYIIYVFCQSVNTSYRHYEDCSSFKNDYNKMIDYIDTVKDMISKDIYLSNDKIIKSLENIKYYFDKDSYLGFSLVSKNNNSVYLSDLNTLSNYVGKVDYQLCISQLLNENYKLPVFLESQFPILDCDNIWNPLISPDKRVSNSLILNVDTPDTVIITGPNKSGKSTFMRSVMINVFLSQSIGISCSDKTQITPFKDLITYLNIPDCIGRESLFEAEVKRCQNYIDRIEKFDGFTIGLIDELFTGTNPREGCAGSYAVANRIASNPMNITLLSTHYDEVVRNLDKMDDYNNYKRFMFKKFMINDKIYDYKIYDGISTQFNALELLNDLGQDIMKDALLYFKTV